MKAFAAIDPEAREALEADLYALLDKFNVAEDGTLVVPSEYLEVVITKKELIPDGSGAAGRAASALLDLTQKGGKSWISMSFAARALGQKWQELKAAGAKSAKIGNEEMSDRVRWIRSYVVKEPDGRLGTFCIYQARDPESIREHARRVGMPGDQIFPVVTTVVVRDDPAEASEAA